MSEDPVVLRHHDAVGQAKLFAAFSIVLFAIPLLAFVFNAPPKWWLLALVPAALLTSYFAMRLLTMKVVLDGRGLNEPAPFRPTVVTPWDDCVRVRRTEDKGAMGLVFLGIAVEHQGGWKHQIVALNMNTRDPSAERTVEDWLKAIRDAKRRYTR